MFVKLFYEIKRSFFRGSSEETVWERLTGRLPG